MSASASFAVRVFSARFRSFAAVAPLLLVWACGAGGGGEADGAPVFSAPFGSAGTAGAPLAAAAPGASPNTSAPPSSGAGGSASGSEGANGNVGLAPSPGQNPGASGSMTAGMPGASGGAAGSTNAPANSGAAGASSGAAGTSGAMPAGSAGSSSMPTSGNNPPPTNAPPAANANCPGQFLCEDFEGAAVGASPNPATWQVIASYSPVAQNAAVQVSTAQAHTGTQSLHVVASGSRNGIVATLPQNRYFLRAWLQVEAAPLGPVFIGLGTDQNSEMRLRIQGQSFAVINIVGSGQDAVVPNAATSGNCPGCVTLTPNRWFCAEFSIDNASQAATLWIDGVEAASIVNGQGGWAAQPATPKLFLGSMGLQGGQAGVFIDDVAVGSTRIGCD